MTQTSEMVKQDNGITDVPAVTADALDIIESRNALFDRIMAVAIKSTAPSDWIDQNGKPYLQSSGAEKVARRFAIRIYDTEILREDLQDENGGYYLYTVTGKASLSDRDTLEAIGTCSSRDPFFSKGNKLSTAQVDIGNIKKAAYTNFMGNAITRLLGIRNMTWDQLEKYGISRHGKASIKYDGGASKAEATKTTENAEKQSKMPFWISGYEGKTYVYARSGNHFSEEFLLNLGLKKSQKKEGIYFSVASPYIESALKDEYEAAQVALREEAANGTAA